MRCPQCKGQLKQSAFGEMVIDECHSCKGMWFDRGELDGVKDEVLPDMKWLDIDRWIEQAEFEVRRESKFCPKCRNIVLTMVLDQKSNTEMSICTQCKGSWLARGQFLYFVNALIDGANQKSASDFVKISLQQIKEMLMHPDSITSEWQDFKSVLELLKHRIFVNHPKLKSLIVGLQKSLPL
jgi:Zn-finger nucleic acid-binding protein